MEFRVFPPVENCWGIEQKKERLSRSDPHSVLRIHSNGVSSPLSSQFYCGMSNYDFIVEEEQRRIERWREL